MNIVITGEGIISAIGYDKATVLAALREKRTGIGQMRWLKSTHRELPVGEVKWSDEELQQQLGLPADELTSRTAMMGMWAVRQALEDASVMSWATDAPAKKRKQGGDGIRPSHPGIQDGYSLLRKRVFICL